MSQIIKEPKVGLELELPAEWKYKRLQTGYILGHPSVKGFILVLLHFNQTLEELKQDLYAGFYDNSGFNLQVEGAIREINEETLIAEYSGMANGEAAKGYGVGLLSPYGSGVLISVFTTPGAFNEEYMDVVEDLAMAVHFVEPVLTSPDEEWTKLLLGQVIENKKPGAANLKLHFHGEDTFTAYSKKHGQRTTAKSDAHANGQWEVLYVMDQPILKLTFFDGSERQYTLHVEADDIYLNNEVWELVDGPVL